jgi:hypothetical protein
MSEEYEQPFAEQLEQGQNVLANWAAGVCSLNSIILAGCERHCKQKSFLGVFGCSPSSHMVVQLVTGQKGH